MCQPTNLCSISQNSATADTDMDIFMLHVKFLKNSVYVFCFAYTVDTDMAHSMSHVRKKSLYIINFPYTINMAHAGFYINNTKKRHVNIYTLFLSISEHTYLCPNSQISGALYTGIEFYVSCQDFFLYISFFLAQ